MLEAVRLFVGYDADEALAFSVFAHSVHRRSRLPVSLQPVMLSQVRGIYDRPRDPLQSTEFSFSRFLVPWLCGYEGWAIFADGDMICRADIADLWHMRDARYAVQVVKTEAVHAEGTKFLGRPQKMYPRKNWSSVMLLNCARWMDVGPVEVSRWSGAKLHRFEWLPDAHIGALPEEWNHLVGVDAPNPEAKIVHYTLGMPFFHGYNECEFAKEWRAERHAMEAYARKAA